MPAKKTARKSSQSERRVRQRHDRQLGVATFTKPPHREADIEQAGWRGPSPEIGDAGHTPLPEIADDIHEQELDAIAAEASCQRIELVEYAACTVVALEAARASRRCSCTSSLLLIDTRCS